MGINKAKPHPLAAHEDIHHGQKILCHILVTNHRIISENR